MDDNRVCLYEMQAIEYPSKAELFRPSQKYPEYLENDISIKSNYVYEAVRECFHLLEFDNENYGLPTWNPLGKIIKKGDCVLIKPNLVMDKNNLNGNTECLYTQPSVVAAVIDYVLIALGNTGEIIIGDAPMQECDFSHLIESSGYLDMVNYYKSKGKKVSLVDFRELTSNVVDGVHVSTINKDAKGTVVDLGNMSEFCGMSSDDLNRMRITNYNPKIMPQHHNAVKHEYYISDYVLRADVIINMPKPKSHRKAGATISLKNFVGVNIRKEFLPHHTKGSSEEGGDEYDKRSLIHSVRSNLYDKKNLYEANQKYKQAKLLRYLIRSCSLILKLKKQKYAEGSWYGNNTISKTVSDINKIVYYADKDGVLQKERQRKIFIIADMVKSGEGEGPVLPTCKNCGIIAMGFNPIKFDKVIASIMGFDYRKIPTIIKASSINNKFKVDDDTNYIVTVSNSSELNNVNGEKLRFIRSFGFEPTSGWKGHIEIK
jgi:uncharacterized protein (DUF362 family)